MDGSCPDKRSGQELSFLEIYATDEGGQQM